MINF
jgi:hypothetical protein